MRKRAALAFGLLALSSAVVMEEVGPNQTAHYALVRALAAGTPRIHRGETGDISLVQGHYYARKAPGLAMFMLPYYEGLRLVKLDSSSDEFTAIWKLGLFGAVVPFLALLLLMRAAVERLVPGYGVASASLLGAGSLLFPFSALLFDHLLSATLGFAAFLLLMVERGRGRPWLLFAAGLAAGLAVVVEFPLVVAAVMLGVIFLPGSKLSARVGAYAVGLLVGVLPLGAFNLWAFGSPTTLTYAHATGGNNRQGLWGVQLPDFHAGLTLLLANKGLFVITPLTAAALVGLPRLWRAGHRRETVACAAIPLLFLIWNAGYYIPFGGSTPGPRFLVPALPFLALPLSAALRARPVLVVGIGVVSALVMWVATATEPMIGDQGIGHWLHLLGQSAFTNTVLSPFGVGHGWAAIVPFAALFLGALALALVSVPSWSSARGELLLLAGALLCWLLVADVVPPLLPLEGAGTTAGTAAVVVLVVALGVGLYLAGRRGWLNMLPLLPATVLAVPHVTAHPRWSLLIAVLALCTAAAMWFGAAPRGLRWVRARASRTANV